MKKPPARPQYKQVEQRLRHLTEVLRAVHNVNQLITHEKDRDALLRRACEILTETRGYRSAWIGALDQAGAIHVVAESGIGAGFAPVRAQLERGEWPECCRKALDRPDIVVMHDTEANCVTCPLAHRFRDTAALAQQLHYADHTYGVLVVALPAAVADDDEEQRLFQELCGDISFALHSIEVGQERQRTEEELLHHHELLNSIIEGAADAIFVKDLEGRYQVINTAGARMIGRAASEIIGRTDAELLPAEIAREFRVTDESVVSSGQSYVREETGVIGGELHTFRAHKAPWRDHSGNILGLIGVSSDITERKRVEDEMRRLNRALRILSECNEILVRATDETELLDRVCRAIVEIGGYGLAWVGFSEDGDLKPVRPAAWSATEPGYIENIRVTWDQSAHGRGPTGTAIRTGQVVFIRDTRSDPDFAPWRDAAVKHGYLSVVSLPLKTPERTLGALLIYAQEVDAFDAKEAGLLMQMADDLAFGIAALRMRSERDLARRGLEVLARFPQENPNPVLRIGSNGALLYANPAATAILTHEGMEAGRLAPDKWRTWMEEALDAGYNKELELDCADRIYVLAFAPITASGYVNVYGREITERIRAEQALRENEERFRLVAQCSSDFIYERDLRTGQAHFFGDIDGGLGYSPEAIQKPYAPDALLRKVREVLDRPPRPTQARREVPSEGHTSKQQRSNQPT